MDSSMLQILFFAVVAALVLARLYQVLGQNRGAEPPPNRQGTFAPPPQPLERKQLDLDLGSAGPDDAGDTRVEPAASPRPGGEGLAAIRAADSSFDPDAFVAGARSAYEMIVTAFGAGDVEALRPLLTPEVHAVYAAEVESRTAAGAKPIEVVRLSESKIVAAELDGKTARIDVAFSSDLADGGDGLRATDETWTFERVVGSRDPNWRLSAVEPA